MGEIKRPPLVTTEGGTLADTSTGEVLPPLQLAPPGKDPYTGALVPLEVSTGPLPAHPRDLPLALERWKQDREYVKRFLLDYLVESEYNDKGYPISGRMHDYYRLPRTEDYRPTAVGAEKVALFFGLFKGPTELHVLSETKEYVSVRARVLLVDAFGRVRGSAEKVGSSAEETFKQSLDKKYKGDFRAGLNDIASRVAKRAYVEAVVITCALGELFNEIAREKAHRPKQVAAAREADPKPDAHGLPTVMPVGTRAGTPLVKLDSDYLKKARIACQGRVEYAKLAEAIDNVLDARREATA